MIACDIDGTLLDYAYDRIGVINRSFVERLVKLPVDAIALVSNQGGISLGVAGAKRADGRWYPTPQLCFNRLMTVYLTLRQYHIKIVRVAYCVYHPRATPNAIANAARQLRRLINLNVPDRFDYTIYETARARKPNPLMLRAVNASIYYGDSDEDEEAARAAGIAFARVPRFQRDER